MRFNMFSHGFLLSFIVFSFLIPVLCSSASNSDADLVSELISLRSNSSDGVIRLSDDLLDRIMLVSPRRSFSFAVFFNSDELPNNALRRLGFLRNQFALLSSSFLVNHPDSNANFFFFDMNYKESGYSFAQFGVRSLPDIRIVSASLNDVENSLKWDRKEDHKSNYIAFPKSLSDIIEFKVRVSLGPINRPPETTPRISRPVFFGLFIVFIFIKAAYLSGSQEELFIFLPTILLNYYYIVNGNFSVLINMFDSREREQMPPFDIFKFIFFSPENNFTVEGDPILFMSMVVGLLMTYLTYIFLHSLDVVIKRILIVSALLLWYYQVKIMSDLYGWDAGYSLYSY